MSSTSINKRLIAGLSAIVIFFIVQAALVYSVGRQTEAEVVSVARKNTIAQTSLGELAVLAQQIRRYEKEYFIYVDNSEKRAGYEKEWTDTNAKISKILDAMNANANLAYSSQDLAQISVWSQAADFYASEMKKLFSGVKNRAEAVLNQPAPPAAPESGKPAAATAKVVVPPEQPAAPAVKMFASPEVNDMIKAGKDRFSAELIKGVATMASAKSTATLALADVASDGFNKLVYGVLITVLIGIAIAVVLLLTLPRSVTQPIQALTEAVDAISKGDVDKPVSANNVEEFTGLASALERMRVAQGLMLQRIRSRN